MTELEEQFEYLLYPPREKRTLSCDQTNLHGTQLFLQKEIGGPGQEKLLFRDSEYEEYGRSWAERKIISLAMAQKNEKKNYKFKVIKKSAWCIAISMAPARAFFVSSDM